MHFKCFQKILYSNNKPAMLTLDDCESHTQNYCDTANGYNHYVNVHKYNEDNNTWEPLGKNIVPDWIYDQYYGFGSSVSLSGDGMTLAVGAVGYDTVLGNGFVTTYSYNDELEESAALGQPLVISDGAESDYRIEVMALAKDASSIIVGSPYEEVLDMYDVDMYEAGHAKVYKLGEGGIPAGCVDGKLDFEYEHSGQMEWKNCKFIAKRPRKRCRDKVIRKACPATCQMKYPRSCVKYACSDVGTLKYKTIVVLKSNDGFELGSHFSRQIPTKFQKPFHTLDSFCSLLQSV